MNVLLEIGDVNENMYAAYTNYITITHHTDSCIQMYITPSRRHANRSVHNATNMWPVRQ